MNSIMVPKSVIEPDYAAEKYFKERFPDEYSNMSDNPNYADSGCGIAIKATDTEQTLVIKDPANEANELCTLKFDTGKLKFTYSKGKMVDNIVNIGTGSTEKLEILSNNLDPLEISVVKTFGGNYAMDSNARWNAVCYGNEKVVAVGRIYDSKTDTSTSISAYSTDGITWTEGIISETDRAWCSVCYGKDKFVAVANESNVFAYSTDGITWIESTISETNRLWTSVCYGNNKFVAIASNSNIFAYSLDGITWNEATVGETNYYWTSVCYGDDKFVAISGALASANIFVYSYDGITWHDGNLDDPTYRYNDDSRHLGPWNSVCYGKDKFVVCGYCSNYCYSYDGINWAMYGDICSVHNQSGLVCYSNGKFVAIGMADCRFFSYSTDGINWKMYALNNEYYMTSICYFPDTDQFIAVGEEIIMVINLPSDFDRGTCSTLSVKYEYIDAPTILPIPYEKAYSNNDDAYSVIDTRFNNMTIYDPTDMTKWTEGTISETKRLWNPICYGNGKFVTMASASNIFAYSTDGINWTEGTISETSRNWRSICYGDNKFVVVARRSDIFAYSADGINWTEVTSNLENLNPEDVNQNRWVSVCYGNGKFVAVGIDGFIYSIDGINWNAGDINETNSDWRSVCYGNGKFVAVCGIEVPSNNIFAYSYDGITWTEHKIDNEDIASDINWTSVCYGKNKFIAIGYNESNIMHIIYSYDGITWTKGITGKTNRSLQSICYGNGKIVVVGIYDNENNEYIAYSYDGITWTEHKIDKDTQYSSVCYGNGKFVAVYNNSNISACLNAPSDYYQFSGWNKSNDETVEYLAKNNAFTVMDAPIMNYDLTSHLQGSICYGNGVYVSIISDAPYTGGYIRDIAYSTDGITWNTTKISETKRLWYIVNFCHDKFIIISYSDIFAYSTDGITWTEITIQSQYWECVCYGNGKYVAIANNSNVFAYSSNGIKWTVDTISETSRKWSTLCYGNNRFIAATWDSNIFAYSTDGINWTEVISTITGSYNWKQAVYIEDPYNRIIIISYNNDKYACTIDGTEWWTDTILEGKNRWRDICYNGSVVMTVSEVGTVAYSTDRGKTWTQVEGYYSGLSITASNDKFVIAHPRKFYYSLYNSERSQYQYNNEKEFNITQNTIISGTWIKKNSMEWNATDRGIFYAPWQSVCYGKDKFVAVNSGNSNFVYSYDGINWTEDKISETERQWQSICYGKDEFVAIAYNSNVFAYSADGISWTEVTVGETKRNWYSVCYGKDKFVAVASDSSIFTYSYDGINWTEDKISETERNWTSVCYGKDKFVAVNGLNMPSDEFAYSTDGINWTKGIIGKKGLEWRSVCYGKDKFVAITCWNTIFAYSTDGITWTEGAFKNYNNNDVSVCYGNDKFVVVGNNNSSSFAYSYDGITWIEDNIIEIEKRRSSVCYGNGKFVAVSGQSNIFDYSSLGEIPSEYRNIYGAIENPPAYVEPEISPIPGLDTFTVGSTFEFGNYQVENETPWKIEWEIVHQTDEYQIAQTKQIIDLRCFDAKEPNNTDANRKNYGNNNWRYSNIQQWLNSDKESWYSAQHTYDQAPNSANTNVNPYDTKKGFLYYFTDEEKALLKDMTLTLANNTVTDGGGSYTWTGKVWLPTYTQMLGGTNNSISEGTAFSKYTSNNDRIKTLHAMCAENNAYCKTNSKTAGTSWYYWTSSANPSHSYDARGVGSGGGVGYISAYNGSFGVAPCICLPRKS